MGLRRKLLEQREERCERSLDAISTKEVLDGVTYRTVHPPDVVVIMPGRPMPHEKGGRR
jgi:hypothetical protein